MPEQTSISYGRGHLPLELPGDAIPTIIRKKPLPKLSNTHASIAQALEQPIGSQSLSELARGRESACILICDITRPVPNALFLRPMIETMIAAGIPRANITVLVATGLHRPNLGEELVELVGDPWVLETVRVENHFARNDDDHVDLGFTSTRRTPVKLNKLFVEADLRIATGLVEPHFMAGWSGGRKVIAPGVAHHETIRTFHSARFMEDPLAVQCNLIGNPLHEEQLEIVKLLGEVYGLNTVLDEDRDLVYVTFGEIIASHAAAVDFVSDATRVAVRRRFRTVVTSSAGYPLDKTYYQTIKGMVTPLDILEPGGTLIMVSECSEGFGSLEFREAQGRLIELGPERFLATLTAKSLAEIDEWQTEMQLKPMRLGQVELYSSGLAGEDRSMTGVTMIDDIGAAIQRSIIRSGDSAVAIIPEGPYVIPHFEAVTP
ncbi:MULTISPECIES: nickel-dependent lactate racemase [Rhizobium]|uniref:Nickel-dependent lactate racemase n=1 Tax=Rhizobium leguminosarum bv. viciae TaxID=387 RepID=A0A8G2IQG6_RHILV|nr:nickel-dependent lactate racemase [Rhizobium leguminosarum]NEI02872.1 nickel-dependent lactate racemase [Rhizobium leguminosarum]NKK10896.1 nickel-dependent lactate racemase [Rhizobium leguminosarum bv. viciae]NKK24362.1 nickel-dependent lactate racemase [Rhizobium leguminosarum bv. viciae]TBX84800.1 nickel-dependent lactate racemase [Rhizobium leguminosarum bv. viciae]TBZ11649.1 nickel-dependent lactate racemase [Rhizobium leguminosarum bv. viciae]